MAVSKRVPPVLVGSGHRSIGELIETENQHRSQVPHRRKRLIAVDDALITFLARSDRRLATVLGDGEQLTLAHAANTSRGADTMDVTTLVHPSYRDVAVRATAAIPGLPVAGVDIVALDLTARASLDNHVVVELNAMPGLRSHHFPDRGKPRDVAKAIVDDVYARLDAAHHVLRRGRGRLGRWRRMLARPIEHADT